MEWKISMTHKHTKFIFIVFMVYFTHILVHKLLKSKSFIERFRKFTKFVIKIGIFIFLCAIFYVDTFLLITYIWCQNCKPEPEIQVHLTSEKESSGGNLLNMLNFVISILNTNRLAKMVSTSPN